MSRVICYWDLTDVEMVSVRMGLEERGVRAVTRKEHAAGGLVLVVPGDWLWAVKLFRLLRGGSRHHSTSDWHRWNVVRWDKGVTFSLRGEDEKAALNAAVRLTGWEGAEALLR